MSRAIPRYRKVAVLAPSGVSTGGPELLHQLVHEIRRCGGNAGIHYVPDPSAETPERYRCYDAPPLRTLDLEKGDCLIAPETMVREVPLVSRADRLIWWLSFDFFQSRRSGRAARAAANVYKTARVRALTACGTGHLFQSAYARAQLNRLGMDGRMLSDYLSFEAPPPTVEGRRDVILYNPKKGIEITRRLEQHLPGVAFRPIINMSKDEVEAAFREAKIYMDFGEHPGKDRLPREAALMGTVVIVGRRGSAAFDEDVALPAAYKLAVDDRLPDAFADLVGKVFADVEPHQRAQDGYRSLIHAGRSAFEKQVQAVFFRQDDADAERAAA